eukprot:CAMPEP_0114553508 /NCGR_PEP_ID=MMETSP0114-20121206/7700_1 /TAXON_ID=31324 /ORGANISM="Goniomonas sp, Strain m" /LENGTH=102 /DNA_ID=CAMNT_0001738465 /DNA_START=9 /DNA_END=317 /DNA_ORIENTATION=-
MAGATGDEQPANAEIQAICDGVKADATAKAQASGFNGLFTEFTAVSFKTQVVAGTNFFVKVRTGANQFAHVRIFQPLPHVGTPPEVAGIKAGLAESEALEYF